MNTQPVLLEAHQSLKRLLQIAKSGSGQSRRVADFLLAWWDCGRCGGFDFTTMWGCDAEVIDDMVIVFAYIGHNKRYADSLGLGAEFEQVIREWRPELFTRRSHSEHKPTGRAARVAAPHAGSAGQ